MWPIAVRLYSHQVFIMSKRVNYDTVTMEAALKEIKSDGSSLRGLSKKYGVPHSSLKVKLKNSDHKETCGPSPALSNDEVLTLLR
jgi:hypothetical protein